ncbi:MAG: preprotein translocase subunit SecG [Candidatus Peregrinibacteria bacterium]
METFLLVLQVIISILLSIAVLAQQRGTGLSAAFGGGGGFYVSKRGAEKVLAVGTTVLAVMFILNSILFILV